MTTKLGKQVGMVDTEDGAVLFDQRKGTYWQLNASGAFAVVRLLDGLDPSELAVAMTDRYPVEVDRARADIIALLANLSEAGLVTIDDLDEQG